jgi:hypothetical protein
MDLDGDGDLDLLFTSDANLHIRLNNAGTLSTTGTTITLMAGARGRGLVPIDFDRDGDMDLAVATFSGLVVYENTSGTLSPAWTTTNQGSVAHIQVVDWNGDTWPDLIGTDATLGLRVYLNSAAP